MANIDYGNSLRPAGQFNLDGGVVFKTLNEMKDLGINNTNPFRYREDLEVQCIETHEKYIWKELVVPDKGLKNVIHNGNLNFDVTYNDNSVINFEVDKSSHPPSNTIEYSAGNGVPTLPPSFQYGFHVDISTMISYAFGPEGWVTTIRNELLEAGYPLDTGQSSVEAGIIDGDFTYPDGAVADGIDYSNRTFNFFNLTPEPLSLPELPIESGTFTPFINGASESSFAVNGNASGYYYKIGDRVFIDIRLSDVTSDGLASSANNGIVISGLPYNVLERVVGVMFDTINFINHGCRVDPTSNFIRFKDNVWNNDYLYISFNYTTGESEPV